MYSTKNYLSWYVFFMNNNAVNKNHFTGNLDVGKMLNINNFDVTICMFSAKCIDIKRVLKTIMKLFMVSIQAIKVPDNSSIYNLFTVNTLSTD